MILIILDLVLLYNLCSFPLGHNGGIIKADDRGLSPLCVDLLRWFLLLHVRYLNRLSFFVLCGGEPENRNDKKIQFHSPKCLCLKLSDCPWAKIESSYVCNSKTYVSL